MENTQENELAMRARINMDSLSALSLLSTNPNHEYFIDSTDIAVYLTCFMQL